MKRTILIATVAAVVLSACQKENTPSSLADSDIVEIALKGYVQNNDTKVTYSRNNAKLPYSFAWEAADALSLIVADGSGKNNNNKFTNKDGQPGNNKIFTGSVTSWEGQKNVYAVYPFMSYTAASGEKSISYKIINGDDIDNATLRVTRSYQNITAGQNKAETSLLVATAPNSTVGNLEEANLHFTQLMSMLRIGIVDVPSGYTVSSVSLSTDDNLFVLSADIPVSDPTTCTPLQTTSEITSIVKDAVPVEDTVWVNFSFLPSNLVGHSISLTAILKGSTDSKILYELREGYNFAPNTIYCTDIDASSGVTLPYASASVTYGGVTYPTVVARDGNVWFTKNLRYVPAGKTPSSNLDAASISNGVWYPFDLSSPNNFLTDNASIEAKGYLYNAEAAFGLTHGTITPLNYDTYEGTQGICPDGWHIPTAGDIVGLAGKCNGYDANTNAPYYNGSNASTTLANADGMNIGVVGYLQVPNASSTVASKKTSMSYILGSSAYTVEQGNGSLTNTDGSLKNAQYYSFMVATTNGGTFNGAYNMYRSGVSVRCVRKATWEDFE